MDIMYANQMTIAANEKEVILRFACIAPSFGINGELHEPGVAVEKTIILTVEGFEKFRNLVDNTKTESNTDEK